MINGTVGPVVTYQLNGQNVIRSKAKVSTLPPSLAQSTCREQLKLLTLFFKKNKGFLKIGFGHLALGTKYNYHNLAMRFNKPLAVIGEYPEMMLDYEKVVLSKGNLEGPLNPALQRLETGLKFTWDCPSNPDFNFENDQVMMLAYSPELDKSIFIDAGAKRKKEEDFLQLPSYMQKKQLEVYIAFVANDRHQAADSMYLGSISPD